MWPPCASGQCDKSFPDKSTQWQWQQVFSPVSDSGLGSRSLASVTHTVSPVTVTGVPSVSVISVKASVHVFSCLRAWLVMLYVRARGLEGHASFLTGPVRLNAFAAWWLSQQDTVLLLPLPLPVFPPSDLANTPPSVSGQSSDGDRDCPRVTPASGGDGVRSVRIGAWLRILLSGVPL